MISSSLLILLPRRPNRFQSAETASASFDLLGRFGGHLGLSYNQLTSLPESFGNLRVGGDLVLYNNQLTSLPESFGNITVGGDLYLKYSGADIGPAMGEARALNYRNVKGEVHK